MAIQTITYHKRSTGKTGQVLASPEIERKLAKVEALYRCLLYTSPSPRDRQKSRMPSSA